MLSRNGRRAQWQDERLSFKTPDDWLTTPAVQRHYREAIFSRQRQVGDKETQVIGVGHAAFDQAIAQARAQTVALSAVAGLGAPLVIAQVYDRVTESAGAVRFRLYGVEVPDAGAPRVLSDDALLVLLNNLKKTHREPDRPAVAPALLEAHFTQGLAALNAALPGLGLPFTVPDLQPLGMLWPG